MHGMYKWQAKGNYNQSEIWNLYKPSFASLLSDTLMIPVDEQAAHRNVK
jgi:hypothetical protein